MPRNVAVAAALACTLALLLLAPSGAHAVTFPTTLTMEQWNVANAAKSDYRAWCVATVSNSSLLSARDAAAFLAAVDAARERVLPWSEHLFAVLSPPLLEVTEALALALAGDHTATLADVDTLAAVYAAPLANSTRFIDGIERQRVNLAAYARWLHDVLGL